MFEQCARRALLYHTMPWLRCTAREHRYHSRQYLWAKLLFLVTAAYYLDRVGRPSAVQCCRTLTALTAAFVRHAGHHRDVAA